ncbi:uncharacterized protein (DUF924 family) [Rhizobium leucaenae]|nr:uncharacterized protein (DUF924 family) [Rhizobium leucaenae]
MVSLNHCSRRRNAPSVSRHASGTGGRRPGFLADYARTPACSGYVLDQFARNIYRGTPLAFATDGLALQEAKAALEVGADQGMPAERRIFFYMPFEHAEHLAEQDRAVALFRSLGLEEQIDYALRHHAVIAAYGRFPHRNVFLGRTSTEAEKDYLAQPEAGF